MAYLIGVDELSLVRIARQMFFVWGVNSVPVPVEFTAITIHAGVAMVGVGW